MGDEANFAVKPASSEQAVFAEAILLAASEARTAYLDSACGGDISLRRRVEDLLRAADHAGSFLEDPPTGLGSDGDALAAELSEKPGDRIGRYKLLEKIGEGGCGVVYMAEQEEPVRRRVALKVIKLGMDTKSVVARFEAERQALALMDHPNIAKVFDGGATQTGRPFFVMELVRGVRITEFCEEARLSTEARLRLFIQVCQAIQHAHQKGVIHRDLKPSNILVTVNDGVPVPKVIDFGIAKATGQRLTDKTLFTQFHMFMGTPAYTSPEQAEMSSVDIDTRSDIYSLGVLLYELLTGRTPFDGEELLRSGLDEMRRTIREVEPVRPSTRLTSLVADVRRLTANSEFGTRNSELDGTASRRPPPTRELIHAVQGDLDWIVMKCLEKDRSRRYETANGLAADVQRHLDHVPVSARPAGGIHRLRKWVRRNKLAFAAAVALVATVLAGAGASLSQAVRATRAEREQAGLRRLAEAGIRDLRHTVSLLELQRAEDLFRVNDSPAAVAQLAAMLRSDPTNHLAANRLVSALVHRNWALPAAPPMRHADRVISAAFSPDGRRVLSASWDGTAKIWDATTGAALATFSHEDRLCSAQYSPDGSVALTASADGTARVWNASDGALLQLLDHRPRKLGGAEFSPDGRWIATTCLADNTARVWDARSGALSVELHDHDSGVLFARFSPDGGRLATASQSGIVQVWNLESQARQFRWVVPGGRAQALTFSPDGRMVVVAGGAAAFAWNAVTGEPVTAPFLHGDDVTQVAFSPDGRLLLTTSRDEHALMRLAINGHLLGQPLRHEGGVIFGTYSPDGRVVVTSSMDNSARLWDTNTGLPLSQPLRHLEAITQASFSPDGRRLVTASWDQTVQVWNIQPRNHHGIAARHRDAVTSVAFVPNGYSVLSTSLDGTARQWNARTGETMGPPLRHPAGVRHADCSTDGRRIATAADDGTAWVWDAATGEMIAGPMQHAKRVWTVQFSPDGERVATASVDGTARIWNARTGDPLTPPLEHGAAVNAARFSPDGRWLATASENRSARVWDARTGLPVTERLAHADHVEWVEFSSDSRLVVSASSDNTAQIWDARTGRPVGSPFRHARTVHQAAFSPDGSRLATASLDRTARIWDARSGEVLTPQMTHDSPVARVCFSPDGRRLLTSCWGGTSRLWDVTTGRPLTEWLVIGGGGLNVYFDATGRQIAGGARDGSVRILDEPPTPTPVPPWFMELAETVAGMRLGANGSLDLVARQEPGYLIKLVAKSNRDGFYERLGQWFFADPTDRPATPY